MRVLKRLDFLEEESVAVDGLEEPVMEPYILQFVFRRVAVKGLEERGFFLVLIVDGWQLEVLRVPSQRSLTELVTVTP